MVNLYRLKKRGVAPAVALAQELRAEMKARFAELIGHALIVMVEDYPPAGMATPDTPEMWQSLVVGAGVMVYTSIVGAKWFGSQMGLLLDPSRSHPEFCLYGHDLLVNAEFDPLLQASDKLEKIGGRDQQHPEFAVYIGRCAMFEISSDLTLNQIVSQQVNGLMETGPSYVKAPSYRHHRKMIHALQGESHESAEAAS